MIATSISRRIGAGPANPGRCFALLMLACGCTPEGSLGRDGTTDGGSGEGTATGGDPTSSTGGSSGDHDGSGSSDTTSTGVGDTSESTSTGGAICELIGDETACMVCVLAHCCDTQQACLADEQCACALGCVEQTGADSVDTCTTTHCAGSADAFMPQFECAHAQCMDVCPWAS